MRPEGGEKNKINQQKSFSQNAEIQIQHATDGHKCDLKMCFSFFVKTDFMHNLSQVTEI